MVPVFPPSCYFGPAKTHWPYITTGGPPIEKEKKRLFPQRSRDETKKRLQEKLSRAKKQIPVNDKTTHKAGYTEDELIAIFETEDESSKKKRQRNKKKAIRKKRKKLEQKEKLRKKEEKDNIEEQTADSSELHTENTKKEENVEDQEKQIKNEEKKSENNQRKHDDDIASIIREKIVNYGDDDKKEKCTTNEMEEDKEIVNNNDDDEFKNEDETSCVFSADIRSASQDSGNMSEELNVANQLTNERITTEAQSQVGEESAPIDDNERLEEKSINNEKINSIEDSDSEWTVVIKRKLKKPKKIEPTVKSHKGRRNQNKKSNKDRDSSGGKKRRKHANKDGRGDKKKGSFKRNSTPILSNNSQQIAFRQNAVINKQKRLPNRSYSSCLTTSSNTSNGSIVAIPEKIKSDPAKDPILDKKQYNKPKCSCWDGFYMYSEDDDCWLAAEPLSFGHSHLCELASHNQNGVNAIGRRSKNDIIISKEEMEQKKCQVNKGSQNHNGQEIHPTSILEQKIAPLKEAEATKMVLLKSSNTTDQAKILPKPQTFTPLTFPSEQPHQIMTQKQNQQQPQHQHQHPQFIPHFMHLEYNGRDCGFPDSLLELHLKEYNKIHSGLNLEYPANMNW